MSDLLSSICVAVGQLRSGTDVAANRASIEFLVERAAVGGAQPVALPKYATYLGSNAAFQTVAESVPDGETVSHLGELARRHDIGILLGSMVEAGGDGQFYNTSVLIDAAGEVVGTYRKIHLFSSNIPGAGGAESGRITGGSEPAVVTWSGWNLGLSICFDVRFPELYRELTAMHADVMTIPAAFTAFTGKDHWDVLLRARAIENQSYVIAPAQLVSFDGGESFGRSCIIDPWGTVLATVGDSDGIGVAFAYLDHQRVEYVRSVLPALANRRFGHASVLAS